jgi:hypothetical protein
MSLHTILKFKYLLKSHTHGHAQMLHINLSWILVDLVLIDLILFYCFTSRSRIFHSWIWRHYHCQWRVAKFRPLFGYLGLWVGRGLYCATPAVTRGLSCFPDLIRRTTRHLISNDTQEMWRFYSNQEPHRWVEFWAWVWFWEKKLSLRMERKHKIFYNLQVWTHALDVVGHV